MEIARELDSVANEITVPVDIKLKRKSGQKKTNGWKSDKHVNMSLWNDMKKSPKLGVAIGTKIGLA